MNKRDFFKFLGLAPVIIPAVAIAKASEGDEPAQEAVKIVLYGSKKREVPSMSLSNGPFRGGSFTMPEYDTSKSAALSVGNDGHLWIKTNNGKWKRVVTE